MFGFVIWFDSWTYCHSFASKVVLEMISTLEKVLLSKQNLFLAFHKFHNIQDHRDIESPTGGKTVCCEASKINLTIVNEFHKNI